MDERDVYARQFKERYDLNEQQANIWGKFLQRKEDYTQRYGSHYAEILLRKEKEALEAENDKAHKELDQWHDQQWLDFHDADQLPKTYNLPEYLREREMKGLQVEDKEKDMTDSAAAILDRTQQTERSSETLFSNPFKKKMGQEKAHSRETNDIEQSQEHMNSLLSSQRKSHEKEKSDTATITPVSISMRFSQGLGYPGAKDSKEFPADPGKDMDRE